MRPVLHAVVRNDLVEVADMAFRVVDQENMPLRFRDERLQEEAVASGFGLAADEKHLTEWLQFLREDIRHDTQGRETCAGRDDVMRVIEPARLGGEARPGTASEHLQELPLLVLAEFLDIEADEFEDVMAPSGDEAMVDVPDEMDFLAIGKQFTALLFRVFDEFLNRQDLFRCAFSQHDLLLKSVVVIHL